jgi:hypothetical protein
MMAMATPAAAQAPAATGVARHSAGIVFRSGGAARRFQRLGQNRFLGRCGRVGRRCFGRGFDRRLFLGLGYVDAYGGLTEDPEALRDQGFFADSGGSWTENGHAVYAYDRAYPYDWYRGSGEEAAPAEPVASAGPVVRCDVTWVAAARGAQAPVRVCRGR